MSFSDVFAWPASQQEIEEEETCMNSRAKGKMGRTEHKIPKQTNFLPRKVYTHVWVCVEETHSDWTGTPGRGFFFSFHIEGETKGSKKKKKKPHYKMFHPNLSIRRGIKPRRGG